MASVKPLAKAQVVMDGLLSSVAAEFRPIRARPRQKPVEMCAIFMRAHSNKEGSSTERVFIRRDETGNQDLLHHKPRVENALSCGAGVRPVQEPLIGERLRTAARDPASQPAAGRPQSPPSWTRPYTGDIYSKMSLS